MEHRGQFTFYRSFWEAIKGLPKKDRLPILEAIISYALDGDSPKGLTQSQSAFFSLVKPNLDASRKKAANGKQGGSKTKANSKQTEREIEIEKENEKEKEKENEIEIEIEGENDREQTPSTGAMFEEFWKRYPDKRDKEAALREWNGIAPSPDMAEQILDSLDEWKLSSQWCDQDGAFIPMAKNWLQKGYWIISPASGKTHGECDYSEATQYAQMILERKYGAKGDSSSV